MLRENFVNFLPENERSHTFDSIERRAAKNVATFQNLAHSFVIHNEIVQLKH